MTRTFQRFLIFTSLYNSMGLPREIPQGSAFMAFGHFTHGRHFFISFRARKQAKHFAAVAEVIPQNVSLTFVVLVIASFFLSGFLSLA